jgi:hypothetical protein
MYSSPVPDNFKSSDKDAIKLNNLKTWLTVRNDDMYYLTWGNPDFAREYVNGMLSAPFMRAFIWDVMDTTPHVLFLVKIV